jgi:hypothetical protein
MDIDVDVYTAKDGSHYLITLERLRPSISSGVNMDNYNEAPGKVYGVTDQFVIEALLGEDRCFRTDRKPTEELLKS